MKLYALGAAIRRKKMIPVQFDKIQKQFNEVIRHSQPIENPDTEKLFAEWLEAKRDVIEVMNGQLIWEWPEPVYFELDSKDKQIRIDDFIEMVESRWQNYDLSNFINVQRNGFFSNQVVEKYSYHDITIPVGMKLVKAFKFFETSERVLNDIQSAASMIIQEDKIEGTLCLSVHPLDFLSASENTHNWRSCHALDGEYRSGNLSYMVDKSTIMCYLRSKKMEKLPNFPESVPWNSKKWRVYLYFSDNWNMLFAGRQYPCTSNAGLNFVKDKILPLLHMGNWTPWLSKKFSRVEEKGIISNFRSPYVPMGPTMVQMQDLVINQPGSLQFNDLLSSSCYDPLYAFRVEETFYGDVPIFTPNTKFHIGGQVNCCHCGCEPIELSETFMCNECELLYGSSESDMFAICPCCGRRYFYDDGCWVAGADETICPDCWREHTEICEECGDTIYREDARYDRATDTWICKWCNGEINDDWRED